MNRGGRPKHQSYSELSFVHKKENGKNVAVCLVCRETLQNTFKQRLKSHQQVI